MQNKHQNIDLLSYIYDMLIRSCVGTGEIENTSMLISSLSSFSVA